MTYNNIPGTMCDFHEFYKQVATELKSGARIIEVGVADGHSAIFLAETLSEMGKDFHLHMVDSLAYGGTDQANTIIKNITNSGLGNKITFWQIGSLDASCKWPDGWADFVFLDSSHTYEQTKAEIRLWHHKIKNGGILAGHDYFHLDDVRKAVDEVSNARTFNTEKGFGIWSIMKGVNSVN